ncbi:hypothetical protein BCR24_14600 [Enterococcus ureilyticus]|uniref:Transposase DDE domain-containing protein n=1 Tax=Enterococcus ureilyticus TaxID=1131292 RepID=A0A1E5HD29_9ENTE|nr:hypothetical protein BCR24_14600 [Enterococcus ureilyticus]
MFNDIYFCSQGISHLSFSTITRESYRTYKSNPKLCIHCSLLEPCTLSEKHQKVVTRYVWADLMDKLEHQRHTTLNKEMYRKRKQTIERIFADAKEKHGMRWTNYIFSSYLDKNKDFCEPCLYNKKKRSKDYLTREVRHW